MGKTYLDPATQWQKTVLLAQAWLQRHAQAIAAIPDYSEDWSYQHNRYMALYFKDPKAMRSHWAADIFWSFKHYPHRTLGNPWQLAIANRNTANLRQGDCALLLLTNGVARHPIWCVSSKGRRLAAYYVFTDRLGGKGVMNLIEWPDELVGRAPTDPTALAFVVGLRAGWVVSG